jgi:hypothetical protein
MTMKKTPRSLPLLQTLPVFGNLLARSIMLHTRQELGLLLLPSLSFAPRNTNILHLVRTPTRFSLLTPVCIARPPTLQSP